MKNKRKNTKKRTNRLHLLSKTSVLRPLSFVLCPLSFVLCPLSFVLCLLSFTSCGERYIPKPRGYYRIAIPDTAYTRVGELDNERLKGSEVGKLPYSFELSDNARVTPRKTKNEQYWIDITYPAFQVNIHCTYYPVQKNLRELSDDAQDFVYKHAGKASAIPEQGFINEDARVYGVLYELMGNTASPYQFYLTDSTQHFFRGAVYFNCTPNQDSLAPIINYLQQDVRHLMETFTWN